MTIAPAALKRVLKAPGLPLGPGMDCKSLLTLMATVTESIRDTILVGSCLNAHKAKAEAIKIAFVALRTALRAYPANDVNAPPLLPCDWELDMAVWIAEATSDRRRGHPGRAERNALLLLCGVYRMAFAREPSATDKPTRAFVNEWFTVFGDVMREATQHVRPNDRRKPRNLKFGPYKDEALRKALEPYKRNAEVDEYLQAIYEPSKSKRLAELFSKIIEEELRY